MAGTEVIPWHMAYPTPKTSVPTVSREEVLSWSTERVAGRDYVLVDVRRTDFEGGTIRGSVNFPAQSFYTTRATIYAILAATKVQEVVFYCGSSRGRGPRTAGWFADYVVEQQQRQETTSLNVLVLEGGIKGWVAGGEEYTRRMDGYDAAVWNGEK